MTRSGTGIFVVLLASLMLTTAATTRAGGWTTITVEALPEYLRAGESTTLSFTMRMHGVSPLIGAPANLTVRNADGASTEARVAPDPQRPAHYTARFTTPSTAEAWLEISPGAGYPAVRLLPIAVVHSGAAAPPPQEPAERGRNLYVAKGCISCHSHADVAAMPQVNASALVLSARRWPEPYLRNFLADPAGTRPEIGTGMPALQLTTAEIDALVAFLNGPAGS